MRIAYFDCFSGASGDMVLAACIHAGLDVDDLKAELGKLKVDGYAICAEPIRKQGFAAHSFQVEIDANTPRPHRHLADIRKIIEGSKLSAGVSERALAIFTRLTEAEAQAHGTSIEKVHFHEVGAVDAIVDIVGACIALEKLGIEKVYCSPIPTGSGTVKCDHGIMPVPTPATAALLTGVPIARCEEVGELTTPTGAAILTTIAEDFGPMPAMRITDIGIGAGNREGKTRANILRVLIGEAIDSSSATEEADQIMVLEANLDDVSGEVIGYVSDRLFEAGALDVYVTPIYMKKNRPASMLTVLAPPDLSDSLAEILLVETTTFGIRSHLAARQKLARTIEQVETDFGPVRVKVGRRAGEVVTVSPEFEDCREAAKRTGRPLKELMDAALRAWQNSS